MAKKLTVVSSSPCKCACCNKCTLYKFDDGSQACPYGGPFGGYERVTTLHSDEGQAHGMAAPEQRGSGEDTDRGVWYGDVLMSSTDPSETP